MPCFTHGFTILTFPFITKAPCNVRGFFGSGKLRPEIFTLHGSTVKPVLSGHSKIDKTEVLRTDGSLMKVEKYCRMLSWSILQYF